MYRSKLIALSFLVALWILPGISLAQNSEDTFNLLFIHHSVGSNWLSSSNGALRDALEDPVLNSYTFEVHDATYGDTIGDDTDVCDWLPKFQNQLNLVFYFDYSPDHYYTDPNEYNKIVMFKSCYPASDIDALGAPPGDPTSSTKTIWNYKAAYAACAKIFSKHPKILFIVVTAPPRNRLASQYTNTRGLYACMFNEWLAGEFVDEYRLKTGLNNVAVFDWFTNLLAEPKSDPVHPGALKEIYANGSDSHPNMAANVDATTLFIPFVNEAVQSWREFAGSKHSFTIANNDSVYMRLYCKAEYGGCPYVILGTVSGVFPGSVLAGSIHLPLNFDIWTQWTLAYGNSWYLPGFKGYLDIEGKAVAAVHSNKPLPTTLIGYCMHYAYVVHSPIRFASCVIPITFIP